MKKKPEIFLSYAHEDRPKVEKIYDTLRAEGFSPWMDTRDILPGEKWSSVIGRAIQESDFMLVFISRNSVSKRGFVQREINAALSILSERPEAEIFLVPVRLEESELPESLKHIQYVDLFEKEGLRRLLQALKKGRLQGEESLAGIHELKEEVRREAQAKGGRKRSHVFVAMPFKVEMEDTYHYGIYRAVDANGYECERVDKTAFTGDILQQIKDSIETAVAVIAELSGENPNVHLELGYAWGKHIPTILLLRDGEELCFDVRGQRCITYSNIRGLEIELTQEIARLKANGSIPEKKENKAQ
jgi:hypothetical protein